MVAETIFNNPTQNRETHDGRDQRVRRPVRRPSTRYLFVASIIGIVRYASGSILIARSSGRAGRRGSAQGAAPTRAPVHAGRHGHGGRFGAGPNAKVPSWPRVTMAKGPLRWPVRAAKSSSRPDHANWAPRPGVSGATLRPPSAAALLSGGADGEAPPSGAKHTRGARGPRLLLLEDALDLEVEVTLSLTTDAVGAGDGAVEVHAKVLAADLALGGEAGGAAEASGPKPSISARG